MHLPTSTLLLSLLPYLISADQAPLKDIAAGWFDKAKSFIPSAIPDPIDAGASAVAAAKVEKINIRNWQRKLGPKLEGEEEWMIYLTGGNKSCFGRCGHADLVWNESVPLLAALPHTPGAPELKLGRLDCESEAVLCTAWAAAVPSLYHFIFPQKSADAAVSTAASPMHVIPLNASTVSVQDIVSIPRASKSRFADYPEYNGALHPIDSWTAKFGVMIPFGWVLWGFGTMPSWLTMIGISFISRQIMSRRAAARPNIYGNAAPAPGAGAQTPARPAPAAAGGARSGGKKRK